MLRTWRRGTKEIRESRVEAEGSLQAFVDDLHAADPPPPRVPGTAVYLNARRETTPLALHASLEHAHALHESIVIISIETTRTPYVDEADHLVVDSLGYEDDGISHLTAKVGFQEAIKVPHLFALACTKGLEGNAREEDAVYILSQMTLRPDCRAGDEALAQAPLRRPRPQLGQRGRLLPPAGGPHRHPGLDDRPLGPGPTPVLCHPVGYKGQGPCLRTVPAGRTCRRTGPCRPL